MCLFCVPIYFVAIRLLSPLISRQTKSIIKKQAIGIHVESSLTSKQACVVSPAACRMRAECWYLAHLSIQIHGVFVIFRDESSMDNQAKPER